MAEKKVSEERKEEELKIPSMEKELEEIKREFFKFMEFCVPPKEVRDEVMRNLYNIPLSVLKAFRTILDYEIKLLEERIKETERKPKSRRIAVE